MKTRQLQRTSHSLAVVLAAAVRVALEVRIQQTLDKNVEADESQRGERCYSEGSVEFKWQIIYS